MAHLSLEKSGKEAVESRFRGFEHILSSEYSLSSFQCGHCNNECQVNKFTVGSETFFQGDRCDRYSSSHKKVKTSSLPDLFEEHEELLMSAYMPPEGKKYSGTVGIPRGILFSDYYPFFNAFFSELGFQVLPSERTTKRIVAKGIDQTVAEPCFPIKVAHGHATELYEQEPDYLFIPAIITAEKPVGKYSSCVTCPYVQSIPDVIKSALADKKARTSILSPTFFFDRGEAHVKRVLTELASSLGKSKEDTHKAYEVARKALQSFRERIQARGKEVLKNLKDGQTAFVIIGRPYAIHDRAVNMDVAKKVLDEGYLPIPLDYLALGEFDTSGSWPNIYSVQGQKKLAAARMIAENTNLHALVITYFGCGPDAFLDQMFKEELGTHYLTIQIDEHTSDTGIITRIQAYLNSAGRTKSEKEIKSRDTGDTPITEITGKRLWIPDMNKGAWVLASVLKSFGIDAKTLPRSSDPGLSLARKYICGDVCLPMLHTSEDMLQRAVQKDFDPAKEAFFQGKSGGPCRYGMYFMLEKSILDLIRGKVDLVTLGNKNNAGSLSAFFIMHFWDSTVTHDILEKMLFHTRPYEREKGAADRLFEEYVSRLCRSVEEKTYRLDTPGTQLAAIINGGHLAPLRKIVREARDAFAAIRRDKVSKKPLVGIVGEFFVRLHEPSNQNIIRRIEALGGEVWLAPMTEFFAYSNYISSVHAFDRWRDEKKISNLTEALMRRYLANLATRNEHLLFKESLPFLEGFEELPSNEVVEIGAQYINRFFGGEAIMSLGKSEDFARHKLDGIVSVGPFNCMPSLIVSAISRELRKLHKNIPFLNIDFDGYEDSIRDDKISMFMSQVKERHSIK
ncbi:MAG: acyl-CoA dehydratase activase-related protein [Candidatus Xenobiia bacterium LiM19]